MVDIISRILTHLKPRAHRAVPKEICVGAYWTFVSVVSAGQVHGGLASTLSGCEHHHDGVAAVRDAGHLLEHNAIDLASMALSERLLEASIGIATINALLEVNEAACTAVNAADVIAQRASGSRVAVVGHFPFVPQLRSVADTLWVLELDPREGDLPASDAPLILPQADVVALTGTSLLNKTFGKLISLCRADAFVILLGATTPLSSFFFDTGVNAVAGTRIIEPEKAKLAVSQGATFRQIPGKQLLTMFKPGISPS